MKKEVKVEKIEVKWKDIYNKPAFPENVTCYGCGHLVVKAEATIILVVWQNLFEEWRTKEKRHFGKSCKPDYVRIEWENGKQVFIYEERRGEDAG